MSRCWVALVLVPLLVACGGAGKVVRLDMGRGEVLAVSSRDGETAPVVLVREEFKETVSGLARSVRPSVRPLESAQRQFEVPPRSGTYRYDSRHRRLVADGESRLATELPEADAELTRAYLRWCERAFQSGDCLRLLVDGSLLEGDGKYALAMAIAQGSVLGETRSALQDMANPQAVVATMVATATVYMLLWVLPEPISKGLAASITVVLMGYLGYETVWGLISGWTQLVDAVDRATTFDEIRAAGERYGRVMGVNAARLFVMLATAAVGSTASEFAAKVPPLPGSALAAVQASMQEGLWLPAVAEVNEVAFTADGFTIALAPGATAMAAQGDGGGRVEVHHIGTIANSKSTLRGGPWTPRFKELFAKAGMTLKDAANKVSILGHKGPHPEQYHRIVYERLVRATLGCSSIAQCRVVLTKALETLSEEISTPGTELNRLVTRGASQ